MSAHMFAHMFESKHMNELMNELMTHLVMSFLSIVKFFCSVNFYAENSGSLKTRQNGYYWFQFSVISHCQSQEIKISFRLRSTPLSSSHKKFIEYSRQLGDIPFMNTHKKQYNVLFQS